MSREANPHVSASIGDTPDRAQAAAALMDKIAYQLRPASKTTMSPCARCCRPSPGGQPCAKCLTDELGNLIKNYGAAARWLESTKQATQDAGTVLRYASLTGDD